MRATRRFQTDLGLYYLRLRRVCGLSKSEAERWIRRARARGECWIFPDPDLPSGFRLLLLSPSVVPGQDGSWLERKGARR